VTTEAPLPLAPAEGRAALRGTGNAVSELFSTAEERTRWLWGLAIRRERRRWAEPDRCPSIPQDLPLDQVRPNCFVVRRHWIGDAIRAATTPKGQPA
jgi:hypothetical protein